MTTKYHLSPLQLGIMSILSTVGSDLVKSRMIADKANADPGTVRNQLQDLVALGLVESFHGPLGGYRLTCWFTSAKKEGE